AGGCRCGGAVLPGLPGGPPVAREVQLVADLAGELFEGDAEWWPPLRSPSTCAPGQASTRRADVPRREGLPFQQLPPARSGRRPCRRPHSIGSASTTFATRLQRSLSLAGASTKELMGRLGHATRA